MFVNRCIWSATAGGLGDFVVSAAALAGYTPANCLTPLALDSAPYDYFAISGTQHEEGSGTYTVSSTTLSRTTIRNSSTGGAKVNFSSAPTVFMGVATATNIRTVLTANLNFYVRTDGLDTNSGLANTAGGAFLTLQKAYDTVKVLDFNSRDVTINVADGTYTAGVNITSSWLGGGTLTWTGNAGTPANCLISTTNAACFNLNGAQLSGPMTVNGFKLTTTTSGSCLNTTNGGVGFIKGSNLDFGTSASNHVESTGGARMQLTGNYTISGNATFHLFSISQSLVQTNSMTVTLTGTPAFTIFAYATRLAFIDAEVVTYSGAASAGTTRYVAAENSVIYTNSGASPTYFPGGTGGSTASGGQYL